MEPQHRRPLEIEVDRAGDTAVVHLSGAASMDEADRLNLELRSVASGNFRRLVLDLKDLEFICSMGLGALIVAHVMCRRQNGEVVLAGVRPIIADLLHTTRLDMIFPAFRTVAEALGH